MDAATRRLSAPWRGRTALVIGNGRSRVGFDLGRARELGWVTIGCNQIHHDFLPDAIVAVDADASRELMERVPETVIRFVHQDLAGHLGPTMVPLNQQLRLSCQDCAGVAATVAAICLGSERLVMLGHDLDGRPSIYHGRPNTCDRLPSLKATVNPWRRRLESVLSAWGSDNVATLTPTPLPIPMMEMP